MSTITVMIAPRLDVLGPGSRVRLVATRSNVLDSPINHYRRNSSDWLECGEMRARSYPEIRAGHYWEVVSIDPSIAALADELERSISPSAFTVAEA